MELSIQTPERGSVDLTEDVRQAIQESGLQEGICVLFCPHTSAALFVNENDGKIPSDLFDTLERLIPERPASSYRHDSVDGNAHAHLKASILGPSLTLPVRGGQLALGTWQQLLLAEFDGPRTRTVSVTLINSLSS